MQIKAGGNILLIDVREPNELAVSSIEGALNIPLGEIPDRLAELDKGQEIVLFCRTGSRSSKAVEILLNAGFKKVKNMRGGINAWARDIDPRLPLY